MVNIIIDIREIKSVEMHKRQILRRQIFPIIANPIQTRRRQKYLGTVIAE